MSRWYLDTSAALKLIAEEAESNALATTLDGSAAELVSSLLLETELRRAAHRSEALAQSVVSEFLETLTLFELDAAAFREAGLLHDPQLRALDALHLTAAVRLRASAVVTYDARMQASGEALGLAIIAPQ